MEKKTDDSIEVPFVLSIGYNPSVAQMNLKGNAIVMGDKEELEKALKEFEQKKAPPQIVVQSISNVVFIESIIVSKTLNIPPPIPLPQIADAGKMPSKKIEGRDYSQ